MSTFVAPSVSETQFSGQYGNQAVAFGTYNPAAPALNDRVYLVKLYAGTKINGARLVTGANGAGSSLDVGFINVDGSPGQSLTQLFTAQDTVTAGSATSATRPFTLTKDAYAVATFKGAVGAAASPANFIDLIINYEFRGV